MRELRKQSWMWVLANFNPTITIDILVLLTNIIMAWLNCWSLMSASYRPHVWPRSSAKSKTMPNIWTKSRRTMRSLLKNCSLRWKRQSCLPWRPENGPSRKWRSRYANTVTSFFSVWPSFTHTQTHTQKHKPLTKYSCVFLDPRTGDRAGWRAKTARWDSEGSA